MHRANVAVLGGRPRHTQRSRSCSSSTPHLMGHGPGGPVKTRGRPHGPGGTAHIKPTSHGPRPGPAHQIARGWAAARPGQPNFQRMRRGPARPTKFSEGGLRPDPVHHIFKFSRPGPARPGSIFRSARPGPDKRPMTSPAKTLAPTAWEKSRKILVMKM